MNKLPCAVVEDLIPLYQEDLTSEETRELIEAHLIDCANCSMLCEGTMEEMPISITTKENVIQENGVRLVRKIKKSRDREKYTFIIFSMFVAIGVTMLSSGFLSTIPLIIIIPFILHLFYEDALVILFSALFATIIIGIADKSLNNILVYPIIVSGCIAGILLAKWIKSLVKGGIST